MILVQHITLEWYKDSRGGVGAVQRSQFPQAAKLPDSFFDYISFGKPVHRMRIEQKIDQFHIQANRPSVMDVLWIGIQEIGGMKWIL